MLREQQDLFGGRDKGNSRNWLMLLVPEWRRARGEWANIVMEGQASRRAYMAC